MECSSSGSEFHHLPFLGESLHFAFFSEGNFARLSILGWQFLSHRILNISFRSLLACKVPAQQSAVALWGLPCMREFFSLVAFEIHSLSLI